MSIVASGDLGLQSISDQRTIHQAASPLTLSEVILWGQASDGDSYGKQDGARCSVAGDDRRVLLQPSQKR
ncbi:hypothetical protein CBM2623_U40012 [Cupriavidus taiwanensis]|nr:hypothetical protein CBM2623_U40012 [Cupriavidus taiwanensis]